MFKQDRSPFVHLFYALWYTVLAHTDIVCYLMVFVNQVWSMHLQFARVHCFSFQFNDNFFFIISNKLAQRNLRFTENKELSNYLLWLYIPKSVIPTEIINHQKSVLSGYSIFQFKCCVFNILKDRDFIFGYSPDLI